MEPNVSWRWQTKIEELQKVIDSSPAADSYHFDTKLYSNLEDSKELSQPKLTFGSSVPIASVDSTSACTSHATVKSSERLLYFYDLLPPLPDTPSELDLLTAPKNTPLVLDSGKSLQIGDSDWCRACEQTKTVFSQPKKGNATCVLEQIGDVLPTGLSPDPETIDDTISWVRILETTKGNITKLIDDHTSYIKTKLADTKRKDLETARIKAEKEKKKQMARLECLEKIRSQVDLLKLLDSSE